MLNTEPPSQEVIMEDFAINKIPKTYKRQRISRQTSSIASKMLKTEAPTSQEVIMEESFVMPSLPEEIIVDILSLLPATSIFRFRCVCKHWCNNLFKNPKLFVKLHLNHVFANNNQFKSLLTGFNVPTYSVSWCSLSQSVVEIDSPFLQNHTYYHIYGSCNGLVFLVGNKGFMLWNPCTKEIKEIPLAEDRISTNAEASSDELDDDTGYSVTRYGFGYSPVLDDYKIIRAEISHNTSDKVRDGCKVEVYSLRSNSWRRKPYVYPYDLFFGGKDIKPVSYNGAPHWIGSSSLGCELSKAASIVIIYFDVKNDTLKEVPLSPELQESLCYDHRTINPYVSYQEVSYQAAFDRLYQILQKSLCDDHRTVEPCISYRSPFKSDIVLGIFCGCLSLVEGGELDSARKNHSDISIWVMKEYGVKESWTKMFSVSMQSIERSLKYSTMTLMDFKNGMILFLKDKSSLVFYDPRDETTREVNTGGLSSKSCSSVDTYVESLVSLNSGIYLGQSVLATKPELSSVSI